VWRRRLGPGAAARLSPGADVAGRPAIEEGGGDQLTAGAQHLVDAAREVGGGRPGAGLDPGQVPLVGGDGGGELRERHAARGAQGTDPRPEPRHASLPRHVAAVRLAIHTPEERTAGNRRGGVSPGDPA
jgi:hypothetical protein